jgi:integrase
MEGTGRLGEYAEAGEILLGHFIRKIGVRRSETRGLDWEDLDLQHQGCEGQVLKYHFLGMSWSGVKPSKFK